MGRYRIFFTWMAVTAVLCGFLGTAVGLLWPVLYAANAAESAFLPKLLGVTGLIGGALVGLMLGLWKASDHDG